LPKDTAAAAQTIRLPVHLSSGLIAASLALTLAAGGLASYFMTRRAAGMKPADILRQL
jgi:ABC-type antimicrobial peptide transport system permease subunit